MNGQQRFPFGLAACLVTAVSLNALNTSLLVTALIPIAEDFGVASSRAILLVTVLYVSSAVAQPALGVLADSVGPRRVLLTGMALVALSGLLGGLGSTFDTLLAARILLGVGTAASYPSAVVILERRVATTKVPTPPRMYTALAVAMQAFAVVGVPVGGLLTDSIGWRSGFWLNTILAIPIMIGLRLWAPADPVFRARDLLTCVRRRLDVPGLMLFLVALAATTDALGRRSEGGTYVALGAAAVAGAVLIWWECCTAQPLIDVRMLWAHRPLARTLIRSFLTWVALYVVFYGVSQWLQGPRGLSASTVAVIMTPMSVISIATAIIAPRSLTVSLLISSGGGVAGAIALSFAPDTDDWSIAVVVTSTVLLGVMNGLSAEANQSAMLREAPQQQIGGAAGLLRTTGHLGLIGATAAISIVYAPHVSDAGLQAVAALAACSAGAVILLTAFGRPAPRRD